MAPSKTVLQGVVLTALVALLALSTDLLAPALPAIAAGFAADQGTVQLTQSMFVLGFATAQLIYGPVSDRFGRRPVLIAGIALYLIASLGCVFAASAEQLAALRFVQAVGACAGPTLGRAVVRDIYGRERAAKALAYIGAAMGLVPAVAPIIGSYLLVLFGWRSLFVFFAGFSAATLLGVLAIVAESNKWKDPHALNPKRLVRNYLEMLGQRAYLGFSLSVALTYSALFMFLSGSGFVLISILGMPVAHFGYYFALLALSYILGTLIAGRLTLRLGIETMIAGATVLGVAAGALIAVLAWAEIAHVGAVVGPMCLHMVAMGVVLPNGMAGAIGPYQEKAGAASALLGFFQMATAGLAGALVGNLFGWTQLSLANAVAVLELASFVVFQILVWRPHVRARAQAAE